MEEDHKVLKVEYLSNCLLDHSQIITYFYMTKLYFVKPLNEDDLQSKS